MVLHLVEFPLGMWRSQSSGTLTVSTDSTVERSILGNIFTLTMDREKEVSRDSFWNVFDLATVVMRETGLRFLTIGGIPSAHYGYPRWSHTGEDIDLVIRRDDAGRALKSLIEAGFEDEGFKPDWMFKASMDGVSIDLIYRVGKTIALDDEMENRKRTEEFEGRSIEMVGPEDLLLMLSASYQEDSPVRLKNMLGILSRTELDWDYLLWRTKDYGRLRFLSFLIYAESKDILLPRSALLDFMRAEGFVPVPSDRRMSP